MTQAKAPPLKPSLYDQMRPEATDELLKQITYRIVEAFRPEKVILFGSYAYGTPHKDSDVDLLVVMQSDDTLHDRIVKVSASAKVPFLPMDIIVRTPSELETRLDLGDHFIAEILEKGRVLYSDDSA